MLSVILTFSHSPLHILHKMRKLESLSAREQEHGWRSDSQESVTGHEATRVWLAIGFRGEGDENI